MNNTGTQPASLNNSYISNESSGNGDAIDVQNLVPGDDWRALLVGSTNTLGGLENPEATGEFVWRKPGETVTGTYDYYVDATHCEVYGTTFRTN